MVFDAVLRFNDVLTTNTIIPNEADLYETISLESSASGGLKPYTFTWDLGDGTEKYEQNITHSYEHPGFYEIKLTVEDSINNIISTSKTILISDDIAPTISIKNPKNAFYLNDNEVFSLKSPLIIGYIKIILEANDNNEIHYLEDV